MQKNYEVIRILTNKDGYQMISEHIIGEQLTDYLKREPQINKELFFAWLKQLVETLQMMERVEYYGCLSPYNIIVKTDKSISFLMVKGQSAHEKLQVMKSKKHLSCFLKGGIYDEIYALGRTLQFLLVKSQVFPKFTKKEARQIKRIVSRCISKRKTYQNFSQIKLDFYKIKTKKITRKSKGIWLAIVSLVLIGTGAFSGKVVVGREKQIDQDIYMELGTLYFYAGEDFARSREILGKISGNLTADIYFELSKFMEGKTELSEEEILKLLEKLESEVGESYLHYCCMFWVYSKLDLEEAKRQMVILGERILNENMRECAWRNRELEQRISERVLEIYLEMGNYEAAMRHCLEEEKLATLITNLCKDENVTQIEKKMYLQKLFQEHKEILNTEAFTKLQAEYGLSMEGDKICFE